ncbi:hypothetical protein [Paramagnetospirillum magnetotacticum]|uniref:hypothetical protein n=1 Tax=Paramagnetospirillum magnetotacticum TaxID=188 RepID=UPI001269E3B4|nr:hypothetical protein [Paramagnetospirillum magnetotacticum]
MLLASIPAPKYPYLLNGFDYLTHTGGVIKEQLLRMNRNIISHSSKSSDLSAFAIRQLQHLNRSFHHLVVNLQVAISPTSIPAYKLNITAMRVHLCLGLEMTAKTF